MHRHTSRVCRSRNNEPMDDNDWTVAATKTSVDEPMAWTRMVTMKWRLRGMSITLHTRVSISCGVTELDQKQAHDAHM